MFQKGKSGNPNGRPKGSITKADLLLPHRLEQHGLDWAKIVADYVNSLPTLKEKFDIIMSLLPKLAVNLEMSPLEMSGIASQPQDSVQNAKAAFDAIKQAAIDAANKKQEPPKGA